MAICCGNLPQPFSVGICCSYLPQLFAVATCRENLPWVCFVYVNKPFFCVSKSFFFVSKSFLIESKTFLYVSKTFFIYRNFFINNVSFCYAAANMGHRTKQIYPKKQKKVLRKDTVQISEAFLGRCSVQKVSLKILPPVSLQIIKIDIK